MGKNLNEEFIGYFCKTCKHRFDGVFKEPCCDCVSQPPVNGLPSKPTCWVRGEFDKDLVERKNEEE